MAKKCVSFGGDPISRSITSETTMIEQPETVLGRHRAVFILLMEALERGIDHASDTFAREGWLRDEHHGHLFSLFAKASAIEGLLRDAEELDLFRLLRGSMESLRVVTPDGDQIWVQRPVDGAVVHGTAIGVPREAVSRPELRFRFENAVQLALNLPDEEDGGRLTRFVMLWDYDEDLGLQCRLAAPFAEGSDDSYWVWDFDLATLLALEPTLPAATEADADLDISLHDVAGRELGDDEGDLDVGIAE
jgi:hypothetical protein